VIPPTADATGGACSRLRTWYTDASSSRFHAAQIACKARLAALAQPEHRAPQPNKPLVPTSGGPFQAGAWCRVGRRARTVA